MRSWDEPTVASRLVVLGNSAGPPDRGRTVMTDTEQTWEDRARFSDGPRLDVPTSLAIPVPDGGRVASSFESPTVVTVSVVYPMNRLDELVRFYKDELDDWSRSGEGPSNGHSVQFHTDTSSVSIGPCIDVESTGVDVDAACVSVTQRT